MGSQLPVCNRAFRAPGLPREHRDAKRLGAQRAEDLARIRWLSAGSVRAEEAQRALCPALQREPPRGGGGKGTGRAGMVATAQAFGACVGGYATTVRRPQTPRPQFA